MSTPGDRQIMCSGAVHLKLHVTRRCDPNKFNFLKTWLDNENRKMEGSSEMTPSSQEQESDFTRHKTGKSAEEAALWTKTWALDMC